MQSHLSKPSEKKVFFFLPFSDFPLISVTPLLPGLLTFLFSDRDFSKLSPSDTCRMCPSHQLLLWHLSEEPEQRTIDQCRSSLLVGAACLPGRLCCLIQFIPLLAGYLGFFTLAQKLEALGKYSFSPGEALSVG